MKKLISLFVAVVFMTGMVVAQNNTATTTQNGNGNSATVDQQGSLHNSVINQKTWGEGHDAVVNQNSGSNNFSDILQDQRGADAYVDQIGTDNVSGLKQSGPNEADIDQVGNRNIVGNTNYSDRAFQKNGNSFASDKNWLDVDQIGDDNKAGIWQEHHAEAVVYQEGSMNETKVWQSGSATGDINSVDVTIFGDENMTDARQYGEGNGILMELGVYGGASYNTVDFDQTGDGNYLETKLVKAKNNEVNGSQEGDDNYFRVGVKGDRNVANMTAVGNQNRGSWGISAQFPEYSEDNTLDIVVTGDGNLTTGQIAGDFNDVDIIQTGDNNMVGTLWYAKDGVHITGHSNAVDIMQLSNGNSSLNTVVGNGNSISVNQK
jgi:hypothetical protein